MVQVPILSAGSPADSGVQPDARHTWRAFSPARPHLWELASLWTIPLLQSQLLKPRGSCPQLQTEQDLQEMLRDHRGSDGRHEGLFPNRSSILPLAEHSLHSPGHAQQQVSWPAASCHSPHLGNVGGSKQHAGGAWFQTSHPSASSLSDVLRQKPVHYHEQCRHTRYQTTVCWVKE